MGTKIRFKRGATAARTAITPESGEPVWDTSEKALYVGDGATAGGVLTGSGGSEDWGSVAEAHSDTDDWGSIV